jgi:hypothetical protein
VKRYNFQKHMGKDTIERFLLNFNYILIYQK